jgi:hypothetical protein
VKLQAKNIYTHRSLRENVLTLFLHTKIGFPFIPFLQKILPKNPHVPNVAATWQNTLLHLCKFHQNPQKFSDRI